MKETVTVRAFNRFYTQKLGLLDERLLKGPFTLTETRILFELAHRDGITASDLVRDLRLDAGYLSRILSKFETNELIFRKPHPSDARQWVLFLTKKGNKALIPLEQAATNQVDEALAPLSSTQRSELAASMRRIERLLSPSPQIPVEVRDLQVGDIGWIIHRQGILYDEEHGWNGDYEVLVAEILTTYVKNRDPSRERAWIAEREGEILGSVFLVRASDDVAKLRLLYVEPVARGLGLGSRLVEECIAYARACSYQRLTLWTQNILLPARTIYKKYGFTLTAEQPHHMFGKDLVAETWDLDLTRSPLPSAPQTRSFET